MPRAFSGPYVGCIYMYVYTYFLACGGHKVPTVSPLFVACVVVATAKGLKGGGRGGTCRFEGRGEGRYSVWYSFGVGSHLYYKGSFCPLEV